MSKRDVTITPNWSFWTITLGSSDCTEDVPIEAIIWYHQLRNELYHSGNGMVPEHHVVAGARAAALNVFQALFGFSLRDRLDQDGTVETVSELPKTQSVEREFLRAYIDFERELRSCAEREVPSSTRGSHIRVLVAGLRARIPEVEHWQGRIESALQIRNRLVHSDGPPPTHEDVENAALTLMELTEVLQKRAQRL